MTAKMLKRRIRFWRASRGSGAVPDVFAERAAAGPSIVNFDPGRFLRLELHASTPSFYRGSLSYIRTQDLPSLRDVATDHTVPLRVNVSEGIELTSYFVTAIESDGTATIAWTAAHHSPSPPQLDEALARLRPGSPPHIHLEAMTVKTAAEVMRNFKGVKSMKIRLRTQEHPIKLGPIARWLGVSQYGEEMASLTLTIGFSDPKRVRAEEIQGIVDWVEREEHTGLSRLDIMLVEHGLLQLIDPRGEVEVSVAGASDERSKGVDAADMFSKLTEALSDFRRRPARSN